MKAAKSKKIIAVTAAVVLGLTSVAGAIGSFGVMKAPVSAAKAAGN